MKCIILAAGYATRLYPLTENQPKALLAVGEKTILSHIMDKVEQLEEIDEVFIVTNDRFLKNFQSWQKTYKPKKATHIISNGTKTNEERLGAVRDMHFAVQHKNIYNDVLLIAGDNLFEFSLKQFVDFFREKNASAIALYNIKDKSKAAKKLGVAVIDNNNRITDFEEKPAQPKSSLAATCCYLLKRESLRKLQEYIHAGRKSDHPGDFIGWLGQQEMLYGFAFTESWFDIGSPESLERANEAYR